MDNDQPFRHMSLTEITRIAVMTQLVKGPAHGYGLVCRISPKKKNTGVIYKILYRLEQDGLVESEWQIQDVGPSRRNYILTDLGMGWLVAERQNFHARVQEMVALLRDMPRTVEK